MGNPGPRIHWGVTVAGRGSVLRPPGHHDMTEGDDNPRVRHHTAHRGRSGVKGEGGSPGVPPEAVKRKTRPPRAA